MFNHLCEITVRQVREAWALEINPGSNPDSAVYHVVTLDKELNYSYSHFYVKGTEVRVCNIILVLHNINVQQGLPVVVSGDRVILLEGECFRIFREWHV